MQTFIQIKKQRPVYFLATLLCLAPLSANAGLLLDLYQESLNSNPALLSRIYAIDQAKAREDQAFSGLLPQISANGSYSYNRYDSPIRNRRYDGLRGTIQARQALFDLPTIFRYQGAKAATQQTEEELKAYRMQLAGEVLDRYLQILEANDQITDVTSEKEATDMQLKRLRKMHERQMAKITDVYEVEAYLQTLKTLEIDARNAKAIGLEGLRETTGVSLETVVPLGKEQFPSKPENIEKWVEEALQNNPNLAALKYAIESADKQIFSTKAEHLPQLAVQLSETYSDQGYDNREVPEYNVGTVSLQLSIPIYEGGRVVAATREAYASQQMTKQQYYRVRRQVEKETRTSFLNAEASHARIASTRQEVYAQTKAFEGQKKGYQLGVSTIVDVLNTRRNLFRARIEVLQALYDYIRSLIGLRIWSGGLSIVNIEEIDAWFIPTAHPLPSPFLPVHIP